MSIASINPATGAKLQEFEPLSGAQIENKLQRSDETFRSYRSSSFGERSEWLLRAAAILEAEQFTFAKLVTMEMGKPLRSATAEVSKCAWGCRYYAENAQPLGIWARARRPWTA